MKDFSIAGIFWLACLRVAQTAGAGIVTAILAGSAHAEPITLATANGGMSVVPASIAAQYPPGAINSVQMADAALAAAALEHDRINRIFADEERACLVQFFASACIEDAKERRRQALQQWRPIQLEANLFKRRARAAESEQALEKRRKEQEERQLEPAPLKANPLQHHGVPEIALPSPPRGAIGDARRAVPHVESPIRHGAKVKPESSEARREARREASRRAANVAAYERKVLASRQRQQEIARRKAAKEERRRTRGQPEQDASANAARE